MIERHHVDTAGKQSWALYSDCETYRYALTRRWDDGPGLLWMMLNPSTADETRNDPTIERCERRSLALGFAAFRVVNLFAYRATQPQDLKKATHPEGPENAAAIEAGCDWAAQVLCGWGAHGDHLQAGPAWRDRLWARGAELYHLGLTKAGHPRHPLYVSYATGPQIWERP